MSSHKSEVLDSVSKRVIGHVQAADGNFSFDPMTIMAIINCIIAIGRLLYSCYSSRSNSEVIYYDAFHKPGPVMRYMIRRQIRKEMPDRSKADKRAVYNAFLNVSSDMSDNEIQQLIQSINEE